MKKNVLGMVLWVVYLVLFLVIGVFVWRLQSNLNDVTTQLHEVSQQSQKAELTLSKYEASHGAAELEMSQLKSTIDTLNSKLAEQDRLVESIGIQLSQ